jgi:hypothetical protein
MENALYNEKEKNGMFIEDHSQSVLLVLITKEKRN